MKGRAAFFTEKLKPFEFREIELPEADPDGLIVRITLANICGSDVHAWEGKTPRSGPTILGHEMTGRVFRLGRNVKTDALGSPLQEGDRIVYAYWHPCFQCPDCLGGEPSFCIVKSGRAGRDRSDQWPYFTGAYADFFFLRRGHYALKVPDALSDEAVAPINCALAEVVYGLQQGGARMGDPVAIQGAGGLGIYACAAAKEMGAGPVVILDRLPDRLETAKRFGADHCLNVDEFKTPEDRAAAVRDLTGGGARVVLEVVGSPAVIKEGILMLRPRGTYMIIGNIMPGQTAELDPTWLYLGSKRMIGVRGYEPWALRKSLDLLVSAKGRYPWDDLLSHKFPFEDLTTAFQLSYDRKVRRAAIAINAS
jgi:threonine dehydrogenase-like Zn-dependent dehydrogenase